MVTFDSTDAVILVGGKGTRLRPLTMSAPKPMLPTAGVPFLTHLITRIRDAGIEHIVLGTSYRAEVFEAYFGDGSKLGVTLDYVVETDPLGTGGGIRNVAPALHGQTTVVFNGDILSGADIGALLAAHAEHDADVTLALTRVADPRAFGCVPTQPDGRVTAFLEKDPNPVTDHINAGIYVFRRDIINTIPVGRPVSIEHETFPALLADGARVFGHLDPGYWRDLGTPADFIAGSCDLVRGIAPSSALPGPAGEAIVLEGARVADSAVLQGGTIVGRGCSVSAGVVLDGAVLFDNAVVSAAAVVRRSVIGAGARIGPRAVLEDCIVGDHAEVGSMVELKLGARVWPEAFIGENAIRFSSDL